MRAEECREELTSNVRQLLENNKDICHRLAKLENFYDAQSMISNRPGVAVSPKLDHAQDDKTPQFLENPAGTASFAFEPDLEASTAYRRAQRETVDYSFRSSVAWSNGLSAFSRLTFGDVSVLSVIALPVHADEISNSHHYTFGGHQPAPLPRGFYDPVLRGVYTREKPRRCIVM
jgi:cell division control protein 24